MSGLNFDFGSDEKIKASSGFDPFEDGTYIARIEKLEVKETKPKEGVEQKASDGTPAQYFNIQWKLVENEKNDGRVVFQIVSIRFPVNALDDTENERKTRESFLSWLNTVTGTDFAGTNQALSINNLVGAKARLVIVTKFNDYKQEKQNEISRVLPLEDVKTDVDAMRRKL